MEETKYYGYYEKNKLIAIMASIDKKTASKVKSYLPTCNHVCRWSSNSPFFVGEYYPLHNYFVTHGGISIKKIEEKDINDILIIEAI